MLGGRNAWRRFPKADRIVAIKDALRVGIVSSGRQNVRLFAAVIRKASLPGADPVQVAFEQLCNRFDLFLARRYAKYSDPQRGLMVFDKSTTETRIQTLAREFKYSGHAWGRTKNYAEVPVFLDSRASRLIQLADLAAFAIFRKYQAADTSLYDVIENAFDREDEVVHGLCERL